MNRNIINKILDIHSKIIWMKNIIRVNKEYSKTCEYCTTYTCKGYLNIRRDYCQICNDSFRTEINFTIEAGEIIFNTLLCFHCDKGSKEGVRISKNEFPLIAHFMYY